MNVAWRGKAPECSLARSATNRSRTRRRPRPRSTFPLPRFYVRDSDVVERAIIATAADTNRGRGRRRVRGRFSASRPFGSLVPPGYVHSVPPGLGPRSR